MAVCVSTTITQGLLLTQVFLKPGGKLLIERRIHHLLRPVDLLPILSECDEHGILVRPPEVSKGRVTLRGRIDDGLAL